MKKMNKILGVAILLIVLTTNFVLAQSNNKMVKVYTIDKKELYGNLKVIDDSTDALLTPGNEEIIIKKKYIDSIKYCSVTTQDSVEFSNRKSQIGFIFSMQGTTSTWGFIGNNTFSKTDRLFGFTFGPGIAINDLCLSVMPSIESLGKNGQNSLLIYPDLKILIGDRSKTVSGYFNFNYFNNAFFGIKEKGSVFNINVACLIGAESAKIGVLLGLKRVNNLSYANLGLTMYLLGYKK